MHTYFRKIIEITGAAVDSQILYTHNNFSMEILGFKALRNKFPMLMTSASTKREL